MSAGYGRGYYGTNQLARAPRRRGGGWVKLALVVGVGAVIWFMWPRRAAPQPEPGSGDEPKPPPPPTPPPPEGQISQPSVFALPPAFPATAVPQVQHAQITQFAQSRGYPSTKEYEDAVVASARQLQDSGAKVMLAPHLAHLSSRIQP